MIAEKIRPYIVLKDTTIIREPSLVDLASQSRAAKMPDQAYLPVRDYSASSANLPDSPKIIRMSLSRPSHLPDIWSYGDV